METAKPILSQAEQFARGVHTFFPGKMLAYNLSPSFNWDAAGMSDAQIEAFTGELAKRGFVWQFITLAGFHSNGLIAHQFVEGYAERGMGAYVEMIQRQERALGVELLKHQAWSGAGLMDSQVSAATGGSATTASLGAGVTEEQFATVRRAARASRRLLAPPAHARAPARPRARARPSARCCAEGGLRLAQGQDPQPPPGAARGLRPALVPRRALNGSQRTG